MSNFVLVTQQQFNEIATYFRPKNPKQKCEVCNGDGFPSRLGIRERCEPCGGTGMAQVSYEESTEQYFSSPLHKWGFQALRFMSEGEGWVVIPYMSIGTPEDALAAAQKVRLRDNAPSLSA